MGTVLAWIIVGGVAGWLASRVVRGTGQGLVGAIVVGVLGPSSADCCFHSCCPKPWGWPAST